MLGRSLAEVEAREAEAARSAAAPTPLHPRPQTSQQPPPSARLLLQVQREADGFARQLQMEQTIAALEAEATRAQAEHCAVRARAEERERELLSEAATARDEAQRAQETAAEEKRRQQRHLRRVQSFPVGHGQFMFDGPARSAALKAVRDAQSWGAATR